MPVDLLLEGLAGCVGYGIAGLVGWRKRRCPAGKDPLVKHASLGVIRLDWHYHPVPGDVGSAGSFEYPVIYRAVPGLTFEVCQSGVLSPEVEEAFADAVRYLDKERNVSVITSDCGFFMWFQRKAREYTEKPVVMSSLAMLPAIHAAIGNDGRVAIFTANSESLAPMHDTVAKECGVDWNESCYLLVGCQDVPGFDAVAHGRPVDLKMVTKGIVKKARQTLEEHKDIHAFLFECTQLPPFSDDVRAATRLPVYDAIVSCNFFIQGFVDNPRFGLNNWHQSWDGKQEDYALGDNLSPKKRSLLIHLSGDSQTSQRAQSSS